MRVLQRRKTKTSTRCVEKFSRALEDPFLSLTANDESEEIVDGVFGSKYEKKYLDLALGSSPR